MNLQKLLTSKSKGLSQAEEINSTIQAKLDLIEQLLFESQIKGVVNESLLHADHVYFQILKEDHRRDYPQIDDNGGRTGIIRRREAFFRQEYKSIKARREFKPLQVRPQWYDGHFDANFQNAFAEMLAVNYSPKSLDANRDLSILWFLFDCQKAKRIKLASLVQNRLDRILMENAVRIIGELDWREIFDKLRAQGKRRGYSEQRALSQQWYNRMLKKRGREPSAQEMLEHLEGLGFKKGIEYQIPSLRTMGAWKRLFKKSEQE